MDIPHRSGSAICGIYWAQSKVIFGSPRAKLAAPLYRPCKANARSIRPDRRYRVIKAVRQTVRRWRRDTASASEGETFHQLSSRQT